MRTSRLIVFRNVHYIGEVGGQPVSLVHVPMGAPATIMCMEEMIACGARVFIGLGYAGSLQPTLSIGNFIIPTSCIAEEGTSPHYLPQEHPIQSSGRVTERLRQACVDEGFSPSLGLHWTTDAVYRESVEKIDEYRRQRVLGVDMETSAMYALGIVRNVDVCNLLVVSDELWHDWRPGFYHAEFLHARECAETIVLRCLENGI